MQVSFLPTALLAIDPGSIVGLVVFVITILSWLAQVAGGNKNVKVPPRQRMGKPAGPIPNQLQEGIELFKKMVAEQQKQNRSPQKDAGGARPVPRQSSPPAIQPVRETRDQQQQKQGKSAPARKPKTESRRKGLGEEVNRRQIPVESDLGRHVVAESQQALSRNSIGDQVRRDFEKNISTEVAAHLGQSRAGHAPPLQRAVQPHGAGILRTILNDKQKISQAVLINEILQRPLALRKK